MLCCRRRGSACGKNEVYILSHKIGGELWQAIIVSFPEAALELEVIPFNVAKFTKSLYEGIEHLFARFRAARVQDPDAVRSSLLRKSYEPRTQCACTK